VVSLDKARAWGFSGPMLRGSSWGWDLRVSSPVEVYSELDFAVPVGLHGDCFDRYLVRVEEMRQSCLLVEQCLDRLEGVTPPVGHAPGESTQMENLIDHFKKFTRGYHLDKNLFSYSYAEAPKGEFGVYLVADGHKPWRCRLRAPGFVHLSSLDGMVVDHMIADVVTVIGTQDIVFGEIDR